MCGCNCNNNLDKHDALQQVIDELRNEPGCLMPIMQRAQDIYGYLPEEVMNHIAKELDIPREDVVFAMDAIVEPVSLYEPVYSDGGDAICVMDQVSDTHNTDELWTDRIALKDALNRLDERERRILSLRFYEGKTQMEVSAEIGISQAQVSRLEKGAMERIKSQL